MARTVLFHELGGPEVMRIEDVEVGDPGPGEVRIRVDAFGLNRAEALFRSGRYIEPVKQFPAKLGYEAAGVVEAVGEGVDGIAVGDSVSTMPAFSQNDYGVYGEQAIVPAHAVLARPDSVSAVDGAAVWMPYVTAYGGLVEVGGMRPGDTVVLNAASSSVALAALQVAERTGATAIALTRGEGKKDALLKLGAEHVIVTDTEDMVERVRELTGGRGAEFVFDAVAGPGVLDLMKVVAPDGMMIEYGMLSGQPTPFPGFDLGMPPVSMRTFTMRETSHDPERMRRAVAYVNSGLRSGAFRPVVDRTFELGDIVEAHRYMAANNQVGKIVVTVDR
ncbi:zinc-dependent alcohol dehydrogenase family protein [Actinomadura oligospora]|uniref:zinc-dependent alcohol dehydrogenase family protein n=1 Tax=Actinomadura oligospora TaxID=111804 RepID=UPI00047BF396|nr:zinc-dependent alcohol dehydrogenase family protein [Actinomadura oligospora]